jgi:hypothetical protein
MKKSLDQQLLEGLAKDLTNLWEDWNKVNHHDHTNGLSQKAVNAYRREHPGSKLQTAVTTKPSKLKKGSKAANRRKSFCARMSGNKGPMKKPNGKPTPKALALRRWNCESIEQMAQMIVEGSKMIAELKGKTHMKATEFVTEKWTQKYKSSINCSHPKGFSQRAHCAGKKKHTESMMTMEMTCPDCGMCQTHGNLNEIKKGAKDSNGFTKCWPGKHAEGTKKGRNGGQVRNCVPNESQGVAGSELEEARVRGFGGNPWSQSSALRAGRAQADYKQAEKAREIASDPGENPRITRPMIAYYCQKAPNANGPWSYIKNRDGEYFLYTNRTAADRACETLRNKTHNAGKSFRVVTTTPPVAETVAPKTDDDFRAWVAAQKKKSEVQLVAVIRQFNPKTEGYDLRRYRVRDETQARDMAKRVNGHLVRIESNTAVEQGVAEAAKHGLYYNVNKRKKAGTSRDASSPKAPTAQAWRDAAKTAKTEGAGAQQAAIAIAKKKSGNYTKTGQRKK